jgi:Zn-dependent peptidase ImmA (M78 family)
MLPKSLTVLRKFGRVRLTGRDFVSLCSSNRIELVISDEVTRGFYFCALGKHTIVLPSSQSPEERELTGWHEFGHFLQNFYEKRNTGQFCNLLPDDPEERLADVFAKIAVQPSRVTITGPMDFIRMLLNKK